MADPLSVTGSAVGVISLGLTVCQGLLQYYRAYKNYEEDVLRMCRSVDQLQQILQTLNTTLQATAFVGEAITKVEENILACEQAIKRLDQKLAKVRKADVPTDVSSKVWMQLRRALYPFRESTLAKFREILADLRDGLSLSLGTLQVYANGELSNKLDGLQYQMEVVSDVTVNVHNDLNTVGSNVIELGEGISGLQKSVLSNHTDDRQQKIFEWLSAPDPSSNHHAACRRRQQATGLWLIDGQELADWKTIKSSLLWLHGIPGCGKTILCSGVIDNIQGFCQSNPRHAFAYFYFDFNDVDKRRHGNLLRSLVTQFSLQSTKSSDVLLALHEECQNGISAPDIEKLSQILQILLGGFEHAYIILDALDECQEQEQLLKLIEEIYNLSSNNVSLFVTSRKELGIEASLQSLAAVQLCIENAQVDSDIALHVHEQLQKDPKLKSFPKDIKEEILSVLVGGSCGMFRWAVCQLDELRKCVKIPQLRRALNSLPKTLDATYARILCNIDEVHAEDVHHVLQWLAFSARPLTLREIAEVPAIDFTGDLPKLDLESRLLNPQSILQMCSSLITLSSKPSRWSDLPYYDESDEVRLAHYSVKEYLVSDRIRVGVVGKYSISKIAANMLMAESCLAYLLHFGNFEAIEYKILEEYPLLAYAAEYWPVHAVLLDQNPDDMTVDFLINKLLDPGSKCLNGWLRVYDPDYSRHMGRPRYRTHPLYFASLLGLSKAARKLLDSGADVNAKGGRCGCALQAASVKGFEVLVELLLDRGAFVNAQNGVYHNALQAATYRGHEAIVRLLLDRGANIHSRGENLGNPLEITSLQNRVHVTDLWPDLEVPEVIATPRLYGTALQAAIYAGHENIVRLLLDRGAEVDDGGGYYHSPIQNASYHGYESIVRLLLSHHAEVNNCGGEMGSALQAASYKGFDNIVQLLLDRGAETTHHSGAYGSALQAACYVGNKSTVQLLLDHGADVAERMENGRAALHFAAMGGHEDIINILVKTGADTHTEDIHGWTPCLIAYMGEHSFVDPSLLADFHSALTSKSPLGLRPTHWLPDVQSPGVVICKDGITVMRENRRLIELDLLPLQFFADHPMPVGRDTSYFEVSIIDEGSERYARPYQALACSSYKEGVLKSFKSTICIGVGCRLSERKSLPGWNLGSWGYHGDDGQKYGQIGKGTRYGPTYGTGDVVGCGVDFRTGTVFFTKNGKNLGTAFSNVRGRLFPVLGIGGSNVHTKANFGAEKFRFHGTDDIVARLFKEPGRSDCHSGNIGNTIEDIKV